MDAPTELVALDIDRTLIKTTILSREIAKPLADLIGLTDRDVTAMTTAAAASVGNAFDYLGWIRETIPLSDTQQAMLDDAPRITQAIIDYHTDASGRFMPEFIEAILIPGVFELLEAIEAINAKSLLLTAGGKVLQLVKVRIIQAFVAEEQANRHAQNRPSVTAVDDFVVLDNGKPKAELLDRCFNSGHFEVNILLDVSSAHGVADRGSYRAIRHSFVVDDKLENVMPVGEHVTGLLVAMEGVAQEGRLSLQEVAGRIQEYNTIDKV